MVYICSTGLLQINFCSGYEFSGHTDRNETYMEVAMDLFGHALKSAHQAQTLRIKLTQKATACLTLEVVQVRTAAFRANWKLECCGKNF